MKHEYLREATTSPTYMNSRTLDHPYSVIRAVLELHAPSYEIFDDNEGGTIDGYWCKSCDDAEYPCATIQVIEAQLK
jgi:hypothetical protein